MFPSAQGGRGGRGQSAAKMCNDPVRCDIMDVLRVLSLCVARYFAVLSAVVLVA